MKSTLFSIGWAVMMAVTIVSCKDKNTTEETPEETVTKGQFTLSMDAKWGNEDFVIEQVYVDSYGNRIRVDKFMSYLAQMSLVRADGSEVLLKDFMLADFERDLDLDFEVPVGNYVGLKMGLGVPEAYNKNVDPAQYPSSHPLSVAGSQGMFWYWSTGYIFTKFEGKIDTTGTPDAELLDAFLFHIGDDPYYRVVNFSDLNIQVNTSTAAALQLNIFVDQILVPASGTSIDLATNAVTHTSEQDVLANSFFDNYAAAIAVE